MDTKPALHPTAQTLHAYGLGKLDDASAESVNQHLDGCPDCRQRVGALTSDSFLGRLRDAQARPESFRPAVSSTDGLSMLDRATAPAAPPPASTLPPGLADLPNYEILRELGQGGMGTVFLARNTLMGRMEVLKVVSGHLVNRRGIIDRFLGEIRNAAKLHHPNIVAAYTAHQLGESLVLAMEYVEGLDLSRLVKARGPLPVANACSYVHQAALGLQHAHEHGMVHRDIKPGNLMLAKQGNRGVIKVLDFGLAKVTSEGAVDGGLTHEGQMLGTPDYIAPEQISNARRADIRADIYSLGCTLYYLLTGQPPFQGDSLYDILQAHHSMDATPLNLARPEVPVEVAAIVAKMMVKEPGRRFQEPKEVAQALKPFFKAGHVDPVGSKPDVSRATPPEPRRETAGAGPAPVQTAARPGPVTASPVSKPGRTPRSEPMWDSLVDLKESERSPAPAPAVASNRRPPWLWPAAAVGVLLLAFLAVWASGVTKVKVKTPEGHIVLIDLDPEATVLVDGTKVKVHWPDGGEPAEITVVPGEHVIQVKKNGFKIQGEKVTVERDGHKPFLVQLEPLETPRPGKDAAKNRPSGSDVAGPQSAPVDRGTPSPPPTSPRVTDGNSNAHPTVDLGKKDGNADLTRTDGERTAAQPGARAEDSAKATGSPKEDSRSQEPVVTSLYGSWRVVGDELRQTSAGGGGLLLGESPLSSYDLHFSAKVVAGDRFWAIFHYASEDDDHCEFEIGDDGGDLVAFKYFVDGKRHDGVQNFGHIDPGRWYNFRIEIRGPVYRLYRDELPLLTARNEQFTQGRIGFKTYEGMAYFKDLLITTADSRVLWKGPPVRIRTRAGKGLLGTGAEKGSRNR